VSVVSDSTAIERQSVENVSWTPPHERSIPRSWHIIKRSMDIGISIAALIVSAPVVMVATIGIIVNSPGSPFFAQRRVGLHGRRFTMFKLRTMRPNAHEHQEKLRATNDVTGPVFKMKKDPRVFFLGRIIRKFSIDELPNFVNVLFGQMSIVGPRPPLPSEVEGYSDYALRRLRTKPGITCIWQISGRSGVDFDEWVQLDNAYIDNWSPAYDLEIIWRTVPAVLLGKGAY
jgi:lipopolysaccharide/colanic/teichoic acid biosynthesis glycosyltransferase